MDLRDDRARLLVPQLPEPAAAALPPSLLGRIKRALIATADPAPGAPPESRDATRFVSLADAEREIRDKLAGFARDIDRNPARQLEVLPDQMDIILNKLATTRADVSEVIADVKLLLEQTDDAVRFAQDTRSAERHSLASN